MIRRTQRQVSVATLMAIGSVLTGGCGGDDTNDASPDSLIVPPAEVVDDSTAEPKTTVVDGESEFVTSGNEMTIIEVDQPTHVVVLLHGHGGLASEMRTIAERLTADGATVVMPQINTSSDLDGFGLQAAQTACAIGFAADLVPEHPLVVLGFSMGGLLAGQYAAAPGLLADPTICPDVDTSNPVDGIVLLDAPVWLEGFAEINGRTSNPLIPVYDPVTIARTNPDLGTYYFVSNEITDYSVDAAERLDAALGTHGAVEKRDTPHLGLPLEDPDDYAAAVLAVIA
jgi:alpha-beta hydrolase superfamily lysophospholipase